MSLIREFLSKFFVHFNCKGLYSTYVYVCLHEFMCTTCTQCRRRPEGVRSPDHQSYRQLLFTCGGYWEPSLTPLQGLYVLLRAEPCACMLCTYTWSTQAREGCGMCCSFILHLIPLRQGISLNLQLSWRLAIPRDCPDYVPSCLSPGVIRTTAVFSHGVWGVNSNHHARTARVLTTEQFP